MNFERADLLGPILDDLSINDQTLFWGLQQKILGEASSRGMTMSTGTATRIFYAFSEKLYGRGKDIFTEMERVLAGIHVDDYEELSKALKSEWDGRIEAVKQIALSEFRTSTAQIRKQFPKVLSESDLLKRTEQFKHKWFAEIDLFCTELHDSQVPRLFLHKGEVFAGNRAARAIFTAASQSIDIIDTYFGSQVFDMLEITAPPVKIRLISDKATNECKQAYQLFNKQYGRIEFRVCDPKDIHDRFVIVDAKQALHIGHSIKDLGKSDSQIDAALFAPVQTRFEELWLKGNPIS